MAIRRWTTGAVALCAAGATGCHSAAPPAPAPPAWQTVFDDTTLGGAVLSAWGTGPEDVYAVGGPLGDSGFTAVAVHYDGSAWTTLSPGGASSFWWVSGSGTADVWMVGENGRITHWDGATFVDHTQPTTATMWGVWAASTTDAWAVGGTPEGGTAQPNDVVLHWDGTSWTPQALPGTPLGRSLNKVWGTASDNLYVVGESGTIWHRRGTTWAQESNPATSNLLTVYGCSATDVYAVGGSDVLHSDGGGTWTEVSITLDNSVNGVTCGPDGDVLVVGYGGLKQRLVEGKWIRRLHPGALQRPPRLVGRRQRRVLDRGRRLRLAGGGRQGSQRRHRALRRRDRDATRALIVLSMAGAATSADFGLTMARRTPVASSVGEKAPCDGTCPRSSSVSSRSL